MTLYRRLRRLVGTIYRRLRRIIRVRWIVTLYLNFRILPLGVAIKLPIVVVGCGEIKFRNLTGEIEFRCPIRFGLIVIGKDVDNMPAAFLPTQFFLAGKMIVRGPVIINCGANVVVWPDSTLDLGEYTLICSGVTLKSVQHVTVGKYAMISSGCFIMDSNIHCIRDMQTGLIKNPTNPIVIGDYCWLSMNASVLGGAKIPPHSILTRYCFVNQDVGAQGGVFDGAPAQLLKPCRERLLSFDIEQCVHRFFRTHPDEQYYHAFSGIEQITDSSIDRFFRP